MKYYVFRLYTQKNIYDEIEDKTATYVHPDRVAALKQYYKLLSGDIDDANKIMVLCMVVDENGVIIARQRFDHPVETLPTEETTQDDENGEGAE